jgi:hypothetical protein
MGHSWIPREALRSRATGSMHPDVWRKSIARFFFFPEIDFNLIP